MTRKRFIKLLMSCRIQRNSARRLADLMCEARYPYFFAWIIIKTFVKKPVEIHAVQWTGDNFSEIVDFVGAQNLVCIGRCGDLDLNIYTLEGNHHAEVGDWIIRGIKGEFYPCKPDIFEQTYEEVSQ